MREKCEQWQLALGLQAEMRNVNLAPDVVTYNAANCACEKFEQ